MEICAGLGEIWMRFIRIGDAHLNKIITNSPYVKGPGQVRDVLKYVNIFPSLFGQLTDWS